MAKQITVTTIGNGLDGDDRVITISVEPGTNVELSLYLSRFPKYMLRTSAGEALPANSDIYGFVEDGQHLWAYPQLRAAVDVS